MTDFSTLLHPDRGEEAHAIHLVDKAGFSDWLDKQSGTRRALLEAQRFTGKTPYQFAILPGEGGEAHAVVATVAKVDALSPWCLARLGDALGAGRYRLAEGSPGPAALGWLLAQHRFTRFKTKPNDPPGDRVLLTSDAASVERTVRIARAVALVRDLVDTPAADMGPAELEAEAAALAKAFDAKLSVTRGDALAEGYPLVQAVGQAATKDRAPRLIELAWGKADAPRVAIVGKGVCFDSGGLDLKPSSGMRLMKKDMGGAAHALALARLVMESRLPVRLHLLIPAVENAVAGNAFRPGDIVAARSGTTVEIDNTDAEGRLILADALTKAGEGEPGLIVDFATLTGAARVALGPDLPALFANDDALAADLAAAAEAEQDPLWRMPLHDPYLEMLKSDVADIANAGGAGMAGAVTAALFLKKFVPAQDCAWAHFDTFAWRPSPKPGRPKGGDALGLRAAFAMLEKRFG